MSTYDDWKTSPPPEWDEADAKEAYIEKHAKDEKEVILANPDAMVDVLMSATAEQLDPLAKRLCKLLIDNIPNWDIQHAGRIRDAATELVDNAAEEVAKMQYQMEEPR